MAQFRILIAAIALGLMAAPVSAGSFGFDLPRLTFPPPVPDTTQSCVDVTAPGTASPCDAIKQ
ncbi:MAG: hypothetical protein WBC95_06730 [Albidovulum sp.]